MNASYSTISPILASHVAPATSSSLVWKDVNSTASLIDSDVGGDNGTEFPSTARLVLVGLVLVLLILVATLGNSTVLAAFRVERRLRTPANYLIASMAVADLLVSVSVMPLSAVYELMGEWRLGRVTCDLWIFLDVTCCTASILSLCVIALDRYWAITDAIKYMQQRTTRRAATMVSLLWAASLCISIAHLAGWRSEETAVDLLVCKISQDYGYTIFSTLCAFYIPTAVILVVYWKIFRAAQHRLRKRLDANASLRLHRARTFETTTSTSTPATANRNRRQQTKGKLGDVDNTTKVKVISIQPTVNKQVYEATNIDGVSQAQPRSSSTSADQAIDTKEEGSAKPLSKSPCVATVCEEIAQAPDRTENNSGRVKDVEQIAVTKERRAAVRLGIIAGIFIACWLPFFLVAIVGPFCSTCYISPLARSIVTWLGYTNSAMNPVLYCVLNKDFQKAFGKMFRRNAYSV